MSTNCAYSQPLDEREIIIYIVTSALSGSLSILGSSLIIVIILRGSVKLSRTRNRLLFCRSIIDIPHSAAIGASILVVPQETSCSIGMGNISTCNAQGFFLQIGAAITAYTAMLSIHFLFMVRNNLNHNMIARKYEIFMHAYACLPPLAVALIGATNKMFFNETSACYIGDICHSLGNCTEGNTWGRGLWILIGTVVYSSFNLSIAVYCLIGLACALRQRNAAMRRHALTSTEHSPEQNRLNQMEFTARETFKQASLYFCASMVTYFWICCAILQSFIGDIGFKYTTWFILLAHSFQPLLGFWNFLIFLQPIVALTRREENNSRLSYLSVCKRLLTSGHNHLIDRRRFRRRGVSDEIVNSLGTIDSEIESKYISETIDEISESGINDTPVSENDLSVMDA